MVELFLLYDAACVVSIPGTYLVANTCLLARGYRLGLNNADYIWKRDVQELFANSTGEER